MTFEAFRRKMRRERQLLLILTLIVAALSFILLMLGDQNYSPVTIFRVLRGEQIKGANYALWSIRIPRVLCAIFAGLSFGAAGNTFQKILQNPLASPDVLGISSGAAAFAICAMLIFGLSGLPVSLLALLGGMFTALIIQCISGSGRHSINRMILTGIGMQAFLQGFINLMLMKNSDYDMGTALRWLSGSLNGSRMNDVYLLAPLCVFGILILLMLEKELKILQLGEELPITLGMNVSLGKALLIFAAVLLSASATSVTGPLASVALMSGPIASRLVKTGGTNTLQAGMVGAALVLCSELIGQFAFSTRYPVGVITGIIGAPYLIILLIRMNRK